jgi:4-hydroxybenzoate polyprenyltransferase
MTKSPRPSPIQTALARSGVLICLCASAFTYVGSLIVAGTVPLLLVAYAGIVATASYAVDRLADSYSSLRRDRMGVAVACLVAVWPLTRGDYLLAALSAAFPLLMVPYATVKRVPLLKAPYVALGWTGLLGFPCIASARVQGVRAAALFLFGKALVNTIACDVADEGEDRITAPTTLPVLLGRARALWVLQGMNAFFAATTLWLVATRRLPPFVALVELQALVVAFTLWTLQRRDVTEDVLEVRGKLLLDASLALLLPLTWWASRLH